MKNKILTIAVAVLLSQYCFAQSLRHPWSVIALGDGRTSGGNLALTTFFGQPAIQSDSAGGVTLDGGFLPGEEKIINPISAFTISVQAKWNMVSVPVQANDLSKSSLFKDASSHAFGFSDGYQTHDVLQIGNGYWLKFPGSGDVGLNGALITLDSINVAAGWNMVGSISSPVGVAGIGSVPPGIVTSNFFGYESGYKLADSIRPGKGYWVKVSQSGKLVLSSSTAMLASSRIRIIPTSEQPPPPPTEKEMSKNKNIPNEFALKQNYPNPFNPSTVIRYQLPVNSLVTLKVYNVLGQAVATLVDEIQDAGYKSVTWNASSYPSGVYYFRIVSSNFSDVKKMLLLK